MMTTAAMPAGARLAGSGVETTHEVCKINSGP